MIITIWYTLDVTSYLSAVHRDEDFFGLIDHALLYVICCAQRYRDESGNCRTVIGLLVLDMHGYVCADVV